MKSKVKGQAVMEKVTVARYAAGTLLLRSHGYAWRLLLLLLLLLMLVWDCTSIRLHVSVVTIKNHCFRDTITTHASVQKSGPSC